MLERHRRDALVAGDIAHQPDEAGHAADRGVAAGERLEFGADVEILALHADHGAQPPVTGGNSATSSPGFTGWSPAT